MSDWDFNQGARARSGGGGGSYGGRSQRVGADRFGNPSSVKRLKCPRNGSPGHIDGLHVAHVEIGGQLYELTVSACKEQKDPRHSGWIRITKKARRAGGGSL